MASNGTITQINKNGKIYLDIVLIDYKQTIFRHLSYLEPLITSEFKQKIFMDGALIAKVL